MSRPQRPPSRLADVGSIASREAMRAELLRALDGLPSLAEVAAYLGVDPRNLAVHARRLGVDLTPYRAYTREDPQQVVVEPAE